MRRYLGVLVPLLVLGAAFAAACGGDSKTVKIPGGGEVSVSDKLPSSFPKDFPVYKGAKVQGSYSGKTSGVSGTVVTWQTGDSVDKVKEFYSNAFQSGAWPTTANGDSNGSVFWGGESSDGKTSFYTLISAADGKTTIIATVGDKSKDGSSSSDGSSDSTPTKTSSGPTCRPAPPGRSTCSTPPLRCARP